MIVAIIHHFHPILSSTLIQHQSQQLSFFHFSSHSYSPHLSYYDFDYQAPD